MNHLTEFCLDTVLEMQKYDPRYMYLVAPYSHDYTAVIEARVDAINHVAGELMGRGVFVFSPISHCHPIARAVGLPGSYEYWQGYNRIMLSGAGSFAVLQLEGWLQSTGVTGEIIIAADLDKPKFYIDPLRALSA